MMNFDDGGRGYKPRNASSCWNVKTLRKRILPSNLQKKLVLLMS